MALWTPENIKHSIWLDASNVEHFFLVSETTVGNWRDHLRTDVFFHGNLDSEYEFAPSRVSGALNGHAAVRFDGFNDFLQATSPINQTSWGVPALALFAAAKDGGSDAQRTVIGFTTFNSNTNPRARLSFRDGVVRADGRRLDADATQSVDIANPTSTSIVSGIFNYAGAELQVGVNGVYAARDGGFQSEGNTPNTNSRYITLGGLFNTVGGTSRLNGDIFEVVVLAYLPTEATRQRIEGYLAHKYGLQSQLDAGHPYFSTAPVTSYGEPNLTLLLEENFNYPDSTDISGTINSTSLGNIEWVGTDGSAQTELIVTDNELKGELTAWDTWIGVAFGNALRFNDGVYDFNESGFYPNTLTRVEYDVFFPVWPLTDGDMSFEFMLQEGTTLDNNPYRSYFTKKRYTENSSIITSGLLTFTLDSLLDGESPGNFFAGLYAYTEGGTEELPRLRAVRVYIQQPGPPSREIIDGGERFVFRAYLTLPGEPDLEVPISSFQARNRLTTRNYLAVVVPDPLPYIDAIAERRDGRLVVKNGFALADGTEVLEEIASGVFSDFRYDLGPFNGSATLVGYDYRNPLAPITRKMRGISFRGMNNSGARRFRCEPDMYLQPGDTADLGDGETMIVDQVQFTVNSNQATMEISEAESEEEDG